MALRHGKTSIVIVLLLIIPVFFIMPTFIKTAEASSWYNSNWLYSKKITIDHTKVAATLTNFPILVSRTDTDFKKAQSDGDDFVFASADNTTKYNHEIEKWDSGNGELVAWVNITSLSSTTDTILYLYYGNPACSSQQNVAGTWDTNYQFIQHMKDTTTSTITDSLNLNNMVKVAANRPQVGISKIGDGQAFNGCIDEIRFSNTPRSWEYINTTYNTINSPTTFMTLGNEQTSWYNTSFNYRKKVTIDHNKVDADLTNFPVLVKATMNTSKVQNTSNDVFFISSTGVKLNHEIESYNSTSGVLVSWVNVTSVSSTTPDTYIYLYYGNTSCSNQQNIPGTWDSDYVGVYHLKEGGTGTRYDSTSNDKDLAPQNYEGDEATSNGKLDGCDNFSGEDWPTPEYLKGSDNSHYLDSASGTVSAWIYIQNPSALGYEPIITKQVRANGGFGFKIQTDKALDFIYYNSGWKDSTSTVIPWTSGMWYHVVGTRGAAGCNIYLNGVEVSYSTHYTGSASLAEYGNGYLNIGEYGSGAYDQKGDGGHPFGYTGKIDEARISLTQKTPQWISTEFKNQNDSANFTIFSAEEQYQGAGGNTAPGTPTNLGPTTRQIAPSVTIYATGSDPDGGSLYLYFYNDDTKEEIGHVNISNNTQGTVAWSGLTRGNTYTFYARGYDGTLWGTNSTTCSFTVNSLPVCTGFMTENLTDPTHIINILPYFSWSYSDGDSDTQAQYEVEVGTTNNSNNIWDPSIVTSSNHYAIYAGSALTRGQLYYVHVRVYDGYEWSEW